MLKMMSSKWTAAAFFALSVICRIAYGVAGPVTVGREPLGLVVAGWLMLVLGLVALALNVIHGIHHRWTMALPRPE
jgi:uncharacterized membrane protein